MRAVSILFVLGVVLGVITLEHKKPAAPLRKARETHRLAVERPRTERR